MAVAAAAAGRNRSIGSLASESPVVVASLAVVVVAAAADVDLVVVVMVAVVAPDWTDWRLLLLLVLLLMRVADEWPRVIFHHDRLCPFRPLAQLLGNSVRPWLTDFHCQCGHCSVCSDSGSDDSLVSPWCFLLSRFVVGLN